MSRTVGWKPAVQLLGLAALVVLGEPVRAQAPPQQNCQMPSAPSQQQTDGVQRRSDLSKTLGECKGVLNAPSVGDGEMVEPAPSTGNQRIITPETLPQSANPSNGSGG
jgi:hypothetical protein